MTGHQHQHDDPTSTCRQLLDSLSDYVDGELGEELCREIEAHMTECDNCRVVVDTLRKTVLLFHALPSDSLPQGVEQRLFKRLQLTDFISTTREG